MGKGVGELDWPTSLPPAWSTATWGERSSAWLGRYLPWDLARECPSLVLHPRAMARILWQWHNAVFAARGRGEPGPIPMSAVIDPELLTGLLPPDDVARLRDLQVPLDTATSAEELGTRQRHLRCIGGHLPRYFTDITAA